ncbi:hypothetical protein F4703DRAFT_1790917 [Phycomyces blakesleeanus]
MFEQAYKLGRKGFSLSLFRLVTEYCVNGIIKKTNKNYTIMIILHHTKLITKCQLIESGGENTRKTQIKYISDTRCRRNGWDTPCQERNIEQDVYDLWSKIKVAFFLILEINYLLIYFRIGANSCNEQLMFY